MLQVFDGHFDNFGFFDAAAAPLQVLLRQQFREIGEAVIHAVSPPLLDDSVRHWVLWVHSS